MSQSIKNFDSNCHMECEKSYRDCMNSREDESVCKMKHAQCSCGCIMES